MSITRALAPLALLLGLTLIPACGGPQYAPRTRSQARPEPAPVAEAETPPVETASAPEPAAAPSPARSNERLAFDAPRWGDRAMQLTSRRVAIIVAADQYRQTSWNLPTVADTGARLRDTLVESMEYAPDDVVLLSGTDVSGERVKVELESLAERLTGDGNSLLVWWIGHGFNIQGRQHYLTSFSSGAGGGGYSHTLPHDDLRGWIGATRSDVERRGGTLVTALVADACRVDTMSAPTKLLDFRPELDIEAFSAPPGQPAEAGSSDGVTAYTGEAIRTMRRLGGNDTVSLIDVLNQAGGSLGRAVDQQAEVRRATQQELLLRNATNLGLVIQAVDAHTGLPVASATIARESGETFQGAEARFTGLGETHIGYEFSVSAPGYFARRDLLPLSASDSGKTVTLPLAREFVALRGRVSLLGRGSAVVEVTGAFENPVGDWHSMRHELYSSGEWELRVPRTAGPRSLRISDGAGVEIASIDFDLGADELTQDIYGGVTVRTREFGEHASTGSAGSVGLASLTASSLDLGDYQMPWDSSTLTETDFADRQTYSSFYRRVDGYVKQRRFDRAATTLETLLGDRLYTSQEAKRDLEGKLHDLRIAHLDQVSKDPDQEQAIEQILASELKDADWILARLIELLGASATHHYEARDFGMALDRLAMARDLGDRAWSRDELFEEQITRIEQVVASLTGRIQQVVSQWRNVASELGREHGEWTSGRELLAAMQRHGIEPESVRSWQAELEREMVSVAVRRNWARALDLKAADELEEALDAIRAVLDDPSCNAHYETKALAERDELWDLVYARAAQRAFEMELQGRTEEAFVAYLDAYEIRSIERSMLEALLREDPGIGTRQPELIGRMDRIRASHDGEALRLEARQAYDQRKYRKACDLLSRAARAYETAEWVSAQGVVLRLRAEFLERDLNDVDAAIAAWTELAELWDAEGRDGERGEAVYNRAWLLAGRDPAASRRGFEEAATDFRRADDVAGEGKALMQLGWAHLPDDPNSRSQERDYEAARRALEEAETLLIEVGDMVRLGACLDGLFRARCLDRPERAGADDAVILARAIAAYRQGGKAQTANGLRARHGNVLNLLSDEERARWESFDDA